MALLPPLILERKLDSRVWGGHQLGAWIGLAEAPLQLAESWQVYEHNTVVNGPDAGQSLAAVALGHGVALLGERSVARYGKEFPLLAKFIDAADRLSIQVHPDDAYAHRVEAASGFHGKTEAWHILQAAADAFVVHGFSQPVTREQFAAAVADGTLLDLLRQVPVRPGDTIFVPAGTVHAINGGIMLFEIQQKSDLTYRVYDYGRPRELHLERALEVINYQTSESAYAMAQPLDQWRSLLVQCPYFVMERWELQGNWSVASDPGSFDILTCIDGTLELDWAAGRLAIRRGDSIVVPAQLGDYRLEPAPAATLLRCYVP